MIEVQSLSKWYGDKQAAFDLNFTIRKGEIVGLLGLNGAGKSTILKTLGTLTQPTHGEALISGHSVRSAPEEVRKHIGYLPDTPPLYEELTVKAYLQFVGSLKGISREHLPGALSEVVSRTRLESVLHKRMGELSHGFKQRTNLAQALIHNPKVLILDEPINGLDPIQIVEMRDLILSFKGKHTVLLSSHILSEITKTCDRILVIDQGRLVAEGTEAELRGEGKGDVLEIELELSTSEERIREVLAPAIRALPGVLGVAIDGNRVRVQANVDRRAEIARLVMKSDVDLLGLRTLETELETLFLKLVSGGQRHE